MRQMSAGLPRTHCSCPTSLGSLFPGRTPPPMCDRAARRGVPREARSSAYASGVGGIAGVAPMIGAPVYLP